MNRSDLIANIENPEQLEQLYRKNKSEFKSEFRLIYPELRDNKLAAFWNARLNYDSSDISWGSNGELAFVIIISAIAGFIAKMPDLFNLNMDIFYQRNFGFIVLPVLTAFFIRKKNLSIAKIATAGIAFLISLIFINVLPGDSKNYTYVLSCIHLPIFLWAVLGFTFVGDDIRSNERRLAFLKYNSDVAIMSALILISGGLVTGITIGLFSVAGFDIHEFYMNNIVIFGLPAVPIFATYITQTNPQLVNRISPIIAKIFSPVVLFTLLVYLVAILYSGKDPYTDRDFLIMFNLLLLGVMAIILFSVAETSKKSNNLPDRIILFALSIVTVIVNCIALSAILFRISAWGLTPNRLAVLGANILMLANLLAVTYRLYKSVAKKADLTKVENAITMFLPVYVCWTIVVAFLFPLIFNFR
jgi:hypothetical protein